MHLIKAFLGLKKYIDLRDILMSFRFYEKKQINEEEK